MFWCGGVIDAANIGRSSTEQMGRKACRSNRTNRRGDQLTEERAAPELLALDLGLNALGKFDVRKSKAVELRYFGGLSMDEIAQALDVSPITVRRDLRLAEAWLHKEMRNGRCALTPERWAQIVEVFHRAAESDPQRRIAVPELACGNDAELREQVEELLAFDTGACSNVQAAVRTEITHVAFSLRGKAVSHYRILEGIDAGGRVWCDFKPLSSTWLAVYHELT